MTSPQVILIGGGVRSGKSAFALTRASALGSRRVFVATAEALDDEMGYRVQRHQAERGDAFRTLEAPRELCACLQGITDADVVVIDCLTLFISNLMVDGLASSVIEQRIDELAVCLTKQPYHSIVVTNEVGLGIVPENAMARAFRDLAGRAHQVLGRVASEVYLGAMGQILRLKPGPVEAVDFRS